jgi:acetolactate synthase I/II/III large subunit
VQRPFRLAQQERPGPIHLELPEDIAHEMAPDVPLVRPHPIEIPVAQDAALDRAANLILRAERPLVMLGAAASRPKLADALSYFVRRMGIPFFNTQMGKGAVAGGSNLYMGTAALSERDYVHQAVDGADLIISIGHDAVEKPPFIMGPKGPMVLHLSYLPATVDEVFFPHAEVVGDVGLSLTLLAERLEGKLTNAGALLPLRSGILARITERADESRYPLTPQRIVHDVRHVMPAGESHLEFLADLGGFCDFERNGFYRVAVDSRRGRWFWIALSNAGRVWTTRARAMRRCMTFMRFWR